MRKLKKAAEDAAKASIAIAGLLEAIKFIAWQLVHFVAFARDLLHGATL